MTTESNMAPLNAMAFEIYKILIDRNNSGRDPYSLASISYEMVDSFIEAGIDWQEDREAHGPLFNYQLRQEELDAPLMSLGLSERPYNALLADGIVTVGQLCKKTAAYLLKIPNIGKKSLIEIKEALAMKNLHLAG